MFAKSKKYEYDITFICAKGNDHFAQPILKELEKKYRIQYLLPAHWTEYFNFKVKGKIVWVEWAMKYAYRVSKKNWSNQKVVFRFHGNEIKTKYMEKIRWNNVDELIFINSKFQDKFIDTINSKVHTKFIPNAIDVESFPYHQSQNGKNICVYGYTFKPLKGYDNLIKTFKKIVDIDSDFHLTIMGMNTNKATSIQNLIDMKILIKEMNLTDKITIFEKEMVQSLVEDRKNVSEFLKNHDIILSYSDTESFHYSFGEGLLSGLEGFYNMWHNPMITEFWADWGCKSEDEFITTIINWTKLSHEEKLKKTKANREYVINNFGSEVISNKFEQLILNNMDNYAKT